MNSRAKALLFLTKTKSQKLVDMKTLKKLFSGIIMFGIIGFLFSVQFAFGDNKYLHGTNVENVSQHIYLVNFRGQRE